MRKLPTVVGNLLMTGTFQFTITKTVGKFFSGVPLISRHTELKRLWPICALTFLGKKKEQLTFSSQLLKTTGDPLFCSQGVITSKIMNICLSLKILSFILVVVGASISSSSVAPESCIIHHESLSCLPAQQRTSSCVPELCLSKPSSVTFVYTGGDCQHSYHAQTNSHFFCLDQQPGGAPIELGTKSYIKAIGISANTEGDSDFYHADWVRVGQTFKLFNNGHDFDDSLVLKIYDSEMNLVQEIIYKTSCEGNLFLCDRFGSVELCGMVNDAQGEVVACPESVI